MRGININIRSDEAKIYFAIIIPIIIFIVYLLYKNMYSTVNNSILEKIDYDKKLHLTNLFSCSNLDESNMYKLSDYYISSSYMSPCLRNLHYDYISLDMVIKVLKSGARYIQIPICQEGVEYETLPVIATGEQGKRMITSINTLEPLNAFKTIMANAFMHSNKSINYPLFIISTLFIAKPLYNLFIK